MNTPGGYQDKVIIYREGVIKLGFFIRSKQAATFRQWATNLVIRHMDQEGVSLGQLFADLRNDVLGEIASVKNDMAAKLATVESSMGDELTGIKNVCAGLRDEIDELKEVVGIVFSEPEEKQIRKKIAEVKQVLNMDGRTVVGHVKKTLNIATPYKSSYFKAVMNTLDNMLGRGLRAVPTQEFLLRRS